MADLRLNTIIPGVRSLLLGETPIQTFQAISDAGIQNVDVTRLAMSFRQETIFVTGAAPGNGFRVASAAIVPDGEIWVHEGAVMGISSGGDTFSCRPVIVDARAGLPVGSPTTPIAGASIGNEVFIGFDTVTILLPGQTIGMAFWAHVAAGGSSWTLASRVSKLGFA